MGSQLCLLAKNFKPALSFLDVDITEIGREVCIIWQWIDADCNGFCFSFLFLSNNAVVFTGKPAPLNLPKFDIPLLDLCTRHTSGRILIWTLFFFFFCTQWGQNRCTKVGHASNMETRKHHSVMIYLHIMEMLGRLRIFLCLFVSLSVCRWLWKCGTVVNVCCIVLLKQLEWVNRMLKSSY